MYRAVTSQHQKLIKFLKIYFDEKGVFYILTAFSSLTESVSINFEHKNFKSLVITTAQLHSTKPDLTFCAGSNPARGVSEIRDGEDL